MPVGVEANVESVRFVEQVGEHAACENVAVVFDGRPDTEKEVFCEGADNNVAVTVVCPDCPGINVMLPLFATEKSKDGGRVPALYKDKTSAGANARL